MAKRPTNSMGAIPDRLQFRVAVRDHPAEWNAPIGCVLYQDADLSDSRRPLYTPAALALAMPSSWRSFRRFVSTGPLGITHRR
jgi:hypothetical protein